MIKNYKPKPIKPFKTLEDEAKFWDTHDTTMLGKRPLSVFPLLEKEKVESLTLRLQRSIKRKLEKTARQKGIGPTTLARMWIVERLISL